MIYKYKCLQRQVFTLDNFSLVPIRREDSYAIMNWRNEQLYHLRQDKFLTEEDQDLYFKDVVGSLYLQDKPDQVLFSMLENNSCIGYGGLVHINWTNRNAEISFIMATELETLRFRELWTVAVSLLEQVAFDELNLHKIFTYAFDIRPNLYPILLDSGMLEEARLREHAWIDKKFYDVVIHSKIRSHED